MAKYIAKYESVDSAIQMLNKLKKERLSFNDKAHYSS